MERSIDGQNVELAQKLLQVLHTAGLDGLGGVLGQWLVVVVQQLLAVERHQALEDAVANAAGAEGTDDLAFQVEGVAGDLGHVPSAANNLLVRRGCKT
jgi:hypothetical protein